MIIKIENGIEHIILDEGERIVLSVIEDGEKRVNITNKDGLIYMSGDKALISPETRKQFRDVEEDSEDNFEMDYSIKELLETCDLWIESFTKIHDLMSNIALSSYPSRKGIRMRLYYTSTVTGECSIKIALINTKGEFAYVVQKGISITLPPEYQDTFKYLYACSLYHFLEKHQKGFSIDKIYEKILSREAVGYEITANFENIKTDSELRELTEKVFGLHNSEMGIENLRTELRRNIKNTGSYETVLESFENTRWPIRVLDNATSSHESLKHLVKSRD